jgi:hypothetical protein
MQSYQQMQIPLATTGSRVSKEGMEAFLDWLEANGLPPREVYLEEDQGFTLHRPEAHAFPRRELSAAEGCVAG